MAIDETPLQAEEYLAQAAALESEGALEAGLLQCDAALALMPDWADAHYLRGSLLASLDRLPDAIAAFERALELDASLHDAREEWIATKLRHSAQTHLANASHLHEQGDLNAALLECRYAIALQPESAAARNMHGTLLKDLGDYSGALAAFRRATELDPDLEAARQNAQWVARQLEQEELIAVARYINPAQAHIARDLLNMEGIDAIVTDESMGNLLGMLSIGGGRVMVRASDVNRAQEVLEAAFEAPEDEETADEADGTEDSSTSAD